MVVKEQVDTVENKVRDVMARLEDKLSRPGMDLEEFQVAAGHTVRQFSHVIRSYQAQLDKIIETKFQRFNCTVNPNRKFKTICP